MFDQPLIFQSVPVERIWGGRKFEKMLGKKLPHTDQVGELWEIADRPECQSIVQYGDLAGRTLHELWISYRSVIFGSAYLNHEALCFPLLIKLIDAKEKLSLQVHPHSQLYGEPKTECWYILEAEMNSILYAGFKKQVLPNEFVNTLLEGKIEELVHTIPCTAGSSILIPSGRLHAIGAGLLLLEVQQNSDTTYRVFDWNRTDSFGMKRKLHISESLNCIKFDDIQPSLNQRNASCIANTNYFYVEKTRLFSKFDFQSNEFVIIYCAEGSFEVSGIQRNIGDFILLPSSLKNRTLSPLSRKTVLLWISLPKQY